MPNYHALWKQFDQLQLENPAFHTVCQQSIDIIQQAFHDFPHLLVSFNGGKDATVVWHLVRLLYAKQMWTEGGMDISDEEIDARWKTVCSCVYFEQEDVFPEVTTFVHDLVQP